MGFVHDQFESGHPDFAQITAYATLAQTEATLELAKQTRIANVLTLSTWSVQFSNGERHAVKQDTGLRFLAEAREALGPECVIELVGEYDERRDADGANPRWTPAGRRDLVERIEPMFGDTVTIPRPVVPHGPAHLTVDAGTAHYLREVVRKIDTGFLTIGGSNVTATVRKLLLDSAAALEVSSGE